MITKLYFFIAAIFFLPSGVFAQDVLKTIEKIDIQLIRSEIPDTLPKITSSENTFKYRESRRFLAAVLCLTLGPFGMHRLYLGTSPKVAAAYSVTLGGIGIIPAVDLLLITFSKDISKFKNNDKVIMW